MPGRPVGSLRRRKLGATAVLVALAAGSCSGDNGPPHSPSEALRTFEIHEDFAIELFAAEPEVVDPVAMAFDPSGQIWVVENSGYPLDSDGRKGRVKLLRDTNHDGLPDSSTVFADALAMPTGIMPWKHGVIVTDPPDVLFLADNDGDGRADERVRLLSGFALTNPQHTVSSPVYGLDNWIYLAHEGAIQSVVFADEFGDPGTEIHFPGRPDSPRLPVDGRCVRFRPDSLELESLAGASQFGIAFTEWGDVLTHNNTYHSRHEVIPARYLRRNPSLRVSSTAQNVFHDPNPAPVYPITVGPRFELLSGVGQMTSAAGLTPYLGGAFPGYGNLAFVGESTHNLVHADRWEPAGSTYLARPIAEGREFLASRDAWFRPVNFTVGPDGALYVIDYYRLVIEHPEWTSAETYDSHRLYDGDALGRIWRITPKGGLPFVAPSLGEAASSELASLLGSSNYWHRITAQQLLVARSEQEAIPGLNELAADPSSPLGRLHALWTLEGLGTLSDDLIRQALKSPAPGVRTNAIRLAERRFRAEPANWLNDLLKLEGDPEAHVRLQLLLTLGEVPLPSLLRVRERMLLADLDDHWFHAAALSWKTSSPSALLERLSDRLGPGESAQRLLESLAALVRGSKDSFSAIVASLSEWHDAPRQAAVLRGLRRALASVSGAPEIPDGTRERILALAASPDPEVRPAALNLLEAVGVPHSDASRRAMGRAIATAQDQGADAGNRADAIRLVSLSSSSDHADLFRRMIQPGEADAVQAAAVAGLVRANAGDLAAFLLERWEELPRPARRVAGEAMTASPDLAEALVDALEGGFIEPWMLEFRSKRRLIMHSDAVLRRRAREVLTQSERDKERVIERYRAAMARESGVAARGKLVFQRDCQECHRLAGEGKDVGPDLGTVRTRPALNLLTDILLPSESISQTYESYIVELTDGDLIEGVLGSQGPGFLTLRREGGEEESIDRDRIESMRVARISAMPSDFEERVNPSEMADLIRYIQSAPVGPNAGREAL